MRVGYFRTSLIGQESTQRITLEELESTRWMNNMEKRPDQNPRSLFFYVLGHSLLWSSSQPPGPRLLYRILHHTIPLYGGVYPN